MSSITNFNNSQKYQDLANESKRLKGTESIEPAASNYLPKEIWKQIFTFTDYQTYQKLSVCNSEFRKIYIDLNGDAIVYVESRLEKLRQISKILQIFYDEPIKILIPKIEKDGKVLNIPIQQGTSTLPKQINYNHIQKCIEKEKNNRIFADSNTEKIIIFDQSIKDVLSEATSELITLIKEIDNQPLDSLNEFLRDLTESQIVNLIDFIEQNKEHLEETAACSGLKLMHACLTNSIEQFESTIEEFGVSDRDLESFFVIAWRKANKQIIEIITKYIKDIDLIEEDAIFLKYMHLNYEENLVKDQLNILDYLLSHENINLYFKENNASFSLIFKNFPFEIKKQIFHKYFQQLNFITDEQFICFCINQCLDPDFLRLYLEDSRINHEEADREAFLKTCRFGSVKTLEILLDYSTFASHFDFNQGFKKACLNGRIEIVKFLSNHPKVTQKNEAFVEACKRKDIYSVEIVNFLLSLSDIDPTYQNNQAFIEACRSGSIKVIKFLSDLPNVNPADQNNEAFVQACTRGNLDIVKFLLTLSNVNPADQNNQAFIGANAYAKTEILKLLLQDKRIRPPSLKK